jgi:choline dehydrogenase-like flavoprotein
MTDMTKTNSADSLLLQSCTSVRSSRAAIHSALDLPHDLPRDYDVIIIGSGAGGGTLARHLAPSGKRILLLERGDFLPREKENWDAEAVFVKNRYVSRDTWYDAQKKPFQPGVHYFVGGATKMYGAALFRLRKEDFQELRHHDGISPAWPISYEDLEPYYTKAEKLYFVHGLRGTDPTEPPASEGYPYPPVAHEPHIQNLSDRLAKTGFHPFPAPCGLLLDEKQRNQSVCLKCDTCDGYPCLAHAKADAEVSGVLPAMAYPNVTLVTNGKVLRINTDSMASPWLSRATSSCFRRALPTLRKSCFSQQATSIPVAWPTAPIRLAETSCSTTARPWWPSRANPTQPFSRKLSA